MSSASTQQKRRSWLLTGSVLCNLFLVAVIGGQYLHQRTDNAPVLMHVLQHITAQLDQKDAEAFKSILHKDAPHYTQAREDLAQARAEIYRELEASTFDPTATRAAMKKWQIAWDNFVGTFSDSLVDALGHLSPGGRRAIIEAAPKQKPIL